MNSKTNQISLRPNNFNLFVGQKKIIDTIKVCIESAKKQNRTLDHIIFYGPPRKGENNIS